MPGSGQRLRPQHLRDATDSHGKIAASGTARERNSLMTGQGHSDENRVADQADQRARSVNIYVDGFNLFYGCLKDTDYKWLDIGALCRRLVPSNPINRIRYFTSRISSRPDAPDGRAHQDAYLRALATIDGLSIHLGHFHSPRVRLPVSDPSACGGQRTVEVIKTQEKGSDVNLATFLLLDAFRRETDIAVVVSNDSDLENHPRPDPGAGRARRAGQSAPGQVPQP